MLHKYWRTDLVFAEQASRRLGADARPCLCVSTVKVSYSSVLRLSLTSSPIVNLDDIALIQ